MASCGRCGGSGTIDCIQCYGSGKSANGEHDCAHCGGSGTQTCIDCGGSGTEEEEEEEKDEDEDD
jgi:hypothetical protein